MIYGLLDVRTHRFRFTVAGHPAPILVREGSPPQRLDVTGFAIGMIDEAEYDESVLDLQRGDRLYLHSDGLTEEVNAQDEEFGNERLLRALADGQALGLQGTIESLVQKVVAWRGEAHLRDDVSVLAVSVA
jgi:sigma-B regulation protein RsbU (phosphoserine phosphatase)